MINAMKNIK